MQVEIKKEKFKMTSASCEKAPTCKDATVRCFSPVFVEGMRCDPSKRWMYCYSYKTKLGMVFSKKLGVYVLPKCPKCQLDLESHMAH